MKKLLLFIILGTLTSCFSESQRLQFVQKAYPDYKVHKTMSFSYIIYNDSIIKEIILEEKGLKVRAEINIKP